MEQLYGSIERLLWFAYRVFFTLVPSIVFLYVCKLFTFQFFPESINKIMRTNSSENILIYFSVVYCVSLILESVTAFLIRTFQFQKIATNEFENNLSFKKLLETGNISMSEILKTNSENKIELNSGVFNFGLLTGNQKSNWFNNYVWFLISREYLLSNTSIVLLFSGLFFCPYALSSYFQKFEFFIVLQTIQFIMVISIIWFSKVFCEFYYPTKNIPFLNLKNTSLWHLIIPTFLFLLSMMLFYWGLFFWASFFCFNALLFVICPPLFFRTLREYINVDYIVMTSFCVNSEKLKEK